jgi:glycosyltransferase involved in cell wall biosynthesis
LEQVNTLPTPAPVLLYLVTEDWFFVSHRLTMARSARDAGFQVHVATRVGRHGAAIEAEGFRLHALDWKRGSLNPFRLVRDIRQIRRLLRALKPALVDHVALQPVVVGSLAAIALPPACLNAVTGLGFAFTSSRPRARALRVVLTALLRHLLNRPRSAVLVENPDDRSAIAAFEVDDSRIFLVPGAGIDTEQFRPLPEPGGPMTVAFVGRLLADKGLPTLVEAHAILAARGRPIRLLLAGDVDPANPTSIRQDEIAAWRRHPWLSLAGYVQDVRDIWKAAHIAVLPSRREGLPKSLLEAAACGRPIVATDVPGCREIARHGVNALLVPTDDAHALADAIERLAGDPVLRARMGMAGRAIIEADFSSTNIGRAIVSVYRNLLGRSS